MYVPLTGNVSINVTNPVQKWSKRGDVCSYVCARPLAAFRLDVCMYARGKNVLLADVDIHTSGRYHNPGLNARGLFVCFDLQVYMVGRMNTL